MFAERTKVVVALSGGVDSSVAAALLKAQNYEVIGMMLRLWSEPGSEIDNRCCAPDAMTIARRVAAQLGIPFYVLDAKEIFFDNIVQYLIDGYAKYSTPNPCLLCNKKVRWGFLRHQAQSIGARFLATGHYASLRCDTSGKIQLYRAADLSKDQSYVLSRLDQDQLAGTLLPIGHLSKPEVRALAKQLNLPPANRPDSQDLCFLGRSDYRDFLQRYAPMVNNPGPILSMQGKPLGIHRGLAFYTIGQRKGLNIPASVPLYVIKKDPLHNTLIVGRAEERGEREAVISDVNWISGEAPEFPFRAQVKIRYKARPEYAELRYSNESEITIHFDQLLYDITPGQAAAIYQDELCLGSGIIC